MEYTQFTWWIQWQKYVFKYIKISEIGAFFYYRIRKEAKIDEPAKNVTGVMHLYSSLWGKLVS